MSNIEVTDNTQKVVIQKKTLITASCSIYTDKKLFSSIDNMLSEIRYIINNHRYSDFDTIDEIEVHHKIGAMVETINSVDFAGSAIQPISVHDLTHNQQTEKMLLPIMTSLMSPHGQLVTDKVVSYSPRVVKVMIGEHTLVKLVIDLYYTDVDNI